MCIVHVFYFVFQHWPQRLASWPLSIWWWTTWKITTAKSPMLNVSTAIPQKFIYSELTSLYFSSIIVVLKIYFLRCYWEDLFLCVVLSSLRFFYFILYLSAAIDNRAPKSISSSQKGKYLSRNELNNHTDKNWQLLCCYIVMNITSIKLNTNLLPK